MTSTCYAQRPHEDAPEPTTTIDGPTVVISDVRFVWWVRCLRCQQTVDLYADGGRIETGIATSMVGKGARGGGRIKNIPRHRWYSRNHPPARPVPPKACPLCGAERWYYVSDFLAHTPQPTVQGDRALSRAYDTLRADPQLAHVIGCADEYLRSRNGRK